ncbi:translation initiation factor IF-2 subunit beta [ANME-2 cluster archaeon]|nr:translation initiation factor IF-2 subunit beta [Methanosarcinales archaeon]RJS72196.1 MAG: translation initiation factor IF-2 subunit beta [ANME-2 cluster archaeon]
MTDYTKSLDRAFEQMPDYLTTDVRFSIPEPEVIIEGKTTVLRNFLEITDTINRDPVHVLKYLMRELGTAGKIDGTRAIFQGKFVTQTIQSQISAYVDEFVICSECGRPDTELVRNDRVLMLKCAACGAHRPIRKRRVRTAQSKDAIEEGGVYDVKIIGVGKKGDGFTHVDKYTIYVPKTIKGEIVSVKVNRVSGTLAFAEILERKSQEST